MEDNIKVSLAVFIILLGATISLYFVNEWHRNEYDPQKWQSEWYSEHVNSNEKMVYLLGDSRIIRINETRVTNDLLIDGYDFTVYDLGAVGGEAEYRLQYLDEMIATKPEIVIFGIDFEDFRIGSYISTSNVQSFEKPESPLPDPERFFQNEIKIIDDLGIDRYNFNNPKLTTLEIIAYNIQDISWWAQRSETQPFAREWVNTGNYELASGSPLTSEQLSELVNVQDVLILVNPDEDSPAKHALEEVIKECQKNNIKIVLVTMPRPQAYLDAIPDERKDKYFELLNTIHENTDVKIYYLHDKYANLDVWWDIGHVTGSPSGQIYNDDIVKIIKDEVNS